jgi:hypothetical protein
MSATTRPRGGSRALIAGLIVAAVIAAGLLARIGVSKPVPTDDKPEPIPTDEEPDKTSTSHPQSGAGDGAALPGGFARDEDGAVAAAIAYTAASQGWLYLDDDEVAAAVAAIAAPQAIERLTREVLADVQTARRELAVSPGRVWWLVHPLAWKVRSYTRSAASVALWTVTVLSAADVAVPQAEWMTVTVDLVWTDVGWRVEAVGDRPGPTPMTGPRDDPWEAEPFDDALAGFTRLGEEPTP